MERILIVAGTRPEIIKLAPIVYEARAKGGGEIILCFTGQHRAMADEAFRMFDILPDIDLNLMKPDQTLNHVSGSILQALPGVLEEVRPTRVMVQGDTTTAAFSAIAAFHLRIPVAHVEAGLRSMRIDAPFPEEANRRTISVVSAFHFCPTQRAVDILTREGIPERAIHLTGNTVVDALRRLEDRFSLDEIDAVCPGLPGPFVLVTAHRRESFGQGLENIYAAIRKASEEFPQLHFVYPVHVNPHVSGPARDRLSGIPNIHLLDPIPYLGLLTLMKHSSFVITDSGGIQEEAPSFGKFCIVLRDVTERMESVEQGISELVGTDGTRILSAIRREATIPTVVERSANPYGDGIAAERIWRIVTAP